MVLWERGSEASASERAPVADCTVRQLGAALRLDSGTLSPLLKRLEAQGFIRRVRRTDDERVVDVTLAKRGTWARSGAMGIPSAMAAATGLSAKERRRLQAALRRLSKTLEEAGEGGGQPGGGGSV